MRYKHMKLKLPPLRQPGFTILEIIVVTIILGLLAALTYGVYNGMQVRALNTSRAAEAQQYTKILQSYIAKYGGVPALSGSYMRCLGEGYPDIDGNGTGDCWILIVGHSYLTQELPSLVTELKKVSPSLTQGVRKPIRGADGARRLGPVLAWRADGFPYVMYFLEKPAATACPYGTSLWQDANVMDCWIRLD